MSEHRDPFAADVRARLREQDERRVRAQAVYEALESTGRLSSHRVLSYRCHRRCMLLDVLELPDGIVVAAPRYKVSPSRGAGTSPANTEDGDRRFRARALYLADAMDLAVNCDHVRLSVITPDDVTTDRAAGTTEVVWPRVP